jgi:hypothetical protein
MSQITMLWHKSHYYGGISGNTNGMVIDPYNQITGLDSILTLQFILELLPKLVMVRYNCMF